MSNSNGTSHRYHVSAQSGEWIVRRDDASRPIGQFKTQAEAIEAARKLLRGGGGELCIHGADGKIRAINTIGQLVMDKISAVEGKQLTDEMKDDFEAVKDLPDDERREALFKKYGKQ